MTRNEEHKGIVDKNEDLAICVDVDVSESSVSMSERLKFITKIKNIGYTVIDRLEVTNTISKGFEYISSDPIGIIEAKKDNLNAKIISWDTQDRLKPSEKREVTLIVSIDGTVLKNLTNQIQVEGKSMNRNMVVGAVSVKGTLYFDHKTKMEKEYRSGSLGQDRNQVGRMQSLRQDWSQVAIGGRAYKKF